MKIQRVTRQGIAAFALLYLFVPAGLAAKRTGELQSDLYLEHVRNLASEQMRGRGTGTPELEKAAQYIVRQFRDAGLRPIDGKNFLQPFSVTTNAKLGNENKFLFEDQKGSARLEFQKDFIPFNFSSRAKLEGDVVFAGFGITAPEYGYDDYEGLDVKGKVVLILRHEPQEFDEKSVFAGKVYTEHAQFFSKLTNAKSHGASGVILINDRANHRSESDDLEKFGRTVGPADGGIPFIQIRAEYGERWLQDNGRKLDDIQAGVDRDLKPNSFALKGIRVQAFADVERAVKTVHNVIGVLPGETDEYVVIGAHYDHLGLGEQFSMAPSMVGTPHPGADDNASGTAGVIELANHFARMPKQKRGIVFMAFAGEELGLLGSSFYVNHPSLPLDKAVAMINMDMIGRMKDGKLYIGGVGTGSSFRQLMERVVGKYDLKVDFSEAAGYGSSDHTSFTTKQVPVLFFFSGLHSDYHKPSDTWDKINAGDAVRVLKVVAETASNLASGEDRPQFVKVKDPRPAHGSGSGSSPSGSSANGYGAYFGSIPDFGEVPNGVKFADVKEGSPAALANLKGGDILVEFDGKPVQNLYDFTYMLRSHQPGDRVKVKVLRGSEPVEAEVELGQRK
jgi:hypothetical protein